ncbi:site-2 protease family protein [Microbacterium sp. zg.Y625]|uniref:M50 family metallopeptidase n=1 Tax=Microbacterium jiangjiandongii TaxID=3049071 RepID=UPI00214C02DB|nr:MULTISPECIES: site-2 protease family protein [unclassified Microbacterium]MCR2793899.1 site-2 protease family protein [Microbacterium sp. zg.Y625]WIM26233.1 site-2 protease family protein [Microbacterium sp. zg-Y625]
MTVIAFVIGVLVLVVGLAVSIALHELGHLVPAKKFGVHVGQYMIGFGPTLWSRRRGETEYGFKAIPLGGYISMSGMYPPSPAAAERGGRAGGGLFATMVQDARAANAETMTDVAEDRLFYRLPVYKRIIIMLGGPLMNLLLALVLFTIMLSGIGVQTATTTIAGVSECLVSGASAQSECTADDPAAPAAAAGILPGDVLVSVDGVPVETFAEASQIIQDSPGETLPVVIERDGETRTLQVTPALTEREIVDADGQVTTAEVGMVGMTARSEYVPQPIWAGAEMTVDSVQRVAGVIVQLPVRVYDTAVALFTGGERDPDGPLSVVGAGRIAGEVAAIDAPVLNRVSGLLGLLASLNLALFVFNLVPLLPLDGGHVAVALWDGLKRLVAKIFRRPPPRPVDTARLVPATFAVVVLMIGMGGILILADVFNPISVFG